VELLAHNDDRAEGLVNSADLGWLVAVDHRRNAANLFQIGDLPYDVLMLPAKQGSTPVGLPGRGA